MKAAAFPIDGNAHIKDFAMPVKVGRRADWQPIRPTKEWQSLKTEVRKEDFEVATDLYQMSSGISGVAGHLHCIASATGEAIFSTRKNR
jgi:hypothetical protein